jgi:hypothetical protein
MLGRCAPCCTGFVHWGCVLRRVRAHGALSRALSSSLELSRALHAIEEPLVIEVPSAIGGALGIRGA